MALFSLLSPSGSNNNNNRSWQKALVICHILLGMSSFVYCYHVYWKAAEACYVIPCYEGPGLQALWKVNKGVSFVGESAGVVSTAHAFLGYLLFRPKHDNRVYGFSRNENNNDDNIPALLLDRAHFMAGIFTGCTFCVALLSLSMVWVWGAEWNLLGDLTRLDTSNKIFEESGRHMVVNEALLRTMTRLFYWSAVMCFLQFLILIQLLVARGSFSLYFGLQGGSVPPGAIMPNPDHRSAYMSSVDEMTPLQAQTSLRNTSTSLNV